MQITIYTDGACDIHADNQPGGWAAILQAVGDDGAVVKEKVISGGAENTTNNRMELAAVTEGLRLLTRATAVTVVTDSRYVIDIATKRKKVVKNESLWQEFFRIAHAHYIDWQHVEGHTGDELNERCDRLAVAEKNRRAKPRSRSPGEAATIPKGMAGIYLSTRYAAKRNATAWAAVIICGETERELSARLAKSSELEGTLIGAINCLESLPAAQDVIVFTAQEYLSKGMNHWLDGWIATGWKTRGGENVKYRSQWEQLRQLTEGRQVQFRFIRTRDDIAEFRRGKELTADVLNRA